jgi:hypothetical protein
MGDYSDWLPPVPCHLGDTGNAPESTPPRTPLPRVGGVSRQAAKGTAAGRGSSPGETSASVTTADLMALIEHDHGKTGHEQFRTWVVAQAIRNALQTFHGCWGLDPDSPGSGEGFISDGQMRALNIAIRRTAHEALRQADMACDAAARPHRRTPRAGEQEALDFCEFQLGTVRDYMEPPGSPELEEAYKRYVRDPDVSR